MTNKEIAKKFKLLAQLMELHGENPFKIKATENAARNIGKFSFSVSEKAESELATLPGIGKSTAAKIVELMANSSLKDIDSLLAITPKGIQSIMNVRGIGPKKALVFWKELKIETLGELWYACQDDKVSKLKGFGAKTQQEIKNLVEFAVANEGKFRFADALPFAKEISSALKEFFPEQSLLSLTGQFRRKMAVLDHIEFILGEPQNELSSFLNAHKDYSNYKKTEEFVEALYKSNFLVRLYHSDETDFHARLMETTGSEKHLSKIKALLNGEIPALESEEAIYKKAGLPFIPALQREGFNEVDQAKQGHIPALIEKTDIIGSLHNHSTWSDGVNSIEEMALYCRDVLNLSYFGISDHSKTAVYANGLKVESVFEQIQEINALNQKLEPFRIFKGIESDILANGSLDYPDEVLAEFDFVVASIHSQLNMDEKKATTRLIKAIENPYTTILGHPTARQLLIRSGYPIDHKKVIDACAANQVVIEINANPLRLDIDWEWIPYCLEKGVMLSINPDAHSVSDLHYTKFGMIMAQKGGLTKENCLNCFPLEKIDQYFKDRKIKYNL